MRGSLKLFSMFGIPVHLHWSFGFILLYAFYLGHAQGAGLLGTVWILGLFIALFGCVLLHEFGHSLTARRYGVNTQDIILTPIGGIARLERMPENPRQEFWVAIAGPAVNVGIAILIFALGKVLYSNELWEIFKAVAQDQFRPASKEESEILAGEAGVPLTGFLFFLPVLLTTNIALVVFNLIPAFPMDGGRVLRALLAMQLGRAKATKIAALVGQGIAVLFVVLGLWQGHLTLALIGFFVFTTARSENSMVQTDSMLANFQVRHILRPTFTHLGVTDWMQTPIEIIHQGHERIVLVFDMQDKLVGKLEEDTIVDALKKSQFTIPVGELMDRNLEGVRPTDDLRTLHYLIRQRGNGILPVVAEDGQILGVVDEAGLFNFMNLQSRLQG